MPKLPGHSNQLPLALQLEPNSAREDLLESPANRLAVELIDSWPEWPSHVVVLAGPVGSGKSHMAGIWAKTASAQIIQMTDLPGLAPQFSEGRNLVLEDATSSQIDETALFHCFNHVKAHGAYLLITSREFPSGWQLQLADLVSRMHTAHIVELEEPDDLLLSQILVKLFADRQIQVEPGLIDYLVTRMERSLGAAGGVVSWLDNEALARRKKITRSLMAEALAHFDIIKGA